MLADAQLVTSLHRDEAWSGRLLLATINPPQEHLWSGQVFPNNCQINGTSPVFTGADCFTAQVIVIAF